LLQLRGSPRGWAVLRKGKEKKKKERARGKARFK
jgi:hypothetical protein